MQAMEISRTALDVEWRRLEIIAENLANANVASTPGTPAYRPLHLVSAPINDFGTYLDRANGSGLDVSELKGVGGHSAFAGSLAPRLAHEPGNPLADKRGFVAYPAIDQAEEMTNLIKTTRVYEANIVAMNMAHEMYAKALQLGGSNS